MVIIGVCVVVVMAGLVAVVRWGGLTVEPPRPPDPGDPGDPPDPGEPPPVGQVVRRYLWDLNLAVIAGIGAGVVAAGAGGRLVMRLLAVTAGDGAQGRITEADQVVGRISVGGTLGFVIFTALFFGTASGGAYMLLRRWLPAGRAGGLAFGGLLLLLAGTRLEPLREGNVDFDLVGPGWVSVVAFSALVLFHGMLVAALAGRASRTVPLLAREPRAIAAHAPLLLLAPLAAVVVLLALLGVIVVLATRFRPLVAAWNARRLVPAGQVVLALAVLAALPGFVTAVSGIVAGASRGAGQPARRNSSTTSPSSRLKVAGSSSMRKCPTPGMTTARTPWRRSAPVSVGRWPALIATTGAVSLGSAARTAGSLPTACSITSIATSGGAADMSAATHSTRSAAAGPDIRRTKARVAATKSSRNGAANPSSSSRVGGSPRVL